MVSVKIPDGLSVSVEGPTLKVQGKSTLSKQFKPGVVKIEVKQGEAEFTPVIKASRKTVAAVNAMARHLQNMLKGVQEGYSKKLSVVYAHFPVTAEVKGRQVLIKNFLGEKSPRAARIMGEAQVKVEKQEITVTGADKESVGQTAANIIQATRVRNRDRRVFQDGIYPE